LTYLDRRTQPVEDEYEEWHMKGRTACFVTEALNNYISNYEGSYAVEIRSSGREKKITTRTMRCTLCSKLYMYVVYNGSKVQISE
jgi:hypothetical protein